MTLPFAYIYERVLERHSRSNTSHFQSKAIRKNQDGITANIMKNPEPHGCNNRSSEVGKRNNA